MPTESTALEHVESVAIVLYDGFDELDAIGPYEVLENAAHDSDLSVRLRTLDSASEVRASHGLCVVPDGTLDESDPALLVIPGGGWNDRSEAGARAEVEDDALPDTISAHYDSGGLLASVCTGGMILAATGVLDGRPAITHGGAIEDLRERGADVIDARVVDDGNVLTAGGVTAGIDLALYLVERIRGVEIAEQVAREMEYERSADVYRADRE
ncbi:AraC family transcriptional regulator [Halobacteriales archaeon QS_3_64_16]|nr:MAG: AraC family transcriptional regulator [Halobacteriales archaeon QS_3_64_16]